MEIAVCLCQVPDTASVISVVDGVVDLSRVNEVMNPFDEYALEEAVRLKERFEGSVVTLFCAAPPSAKEMLRKALAMGGDRAVLISGTEEPSDPFQTALLLSRAISASYPVAPPDLIFCGKHATDFQSAQVPLMLAEMLDMASVSAIITLNASVEALQVEREIEGGIESLDLRYPALFSVEKGLNIPRKTTIKAVIEARKKPIEQISVTLDESPFVTITGMKALVRKKKCRFIPDAKELIRMLSHEEALF